MTAKVQKFKNVNAYLSSYFNIIVRFAAFLFLFSMVFNA